MTGPMGVTSMPAMMGSLAALQGIHASMIALTEANTAATSITPPPGNDGSSAAASTSNIANAMAFSASLNGALEQMEEFLIAATAGGTAVQITDMGSAVSAIGSAAKAVV